MGSSDAVLVSSSSCACFSQGDLASTGLFSEAKKNTNNKLDYYQKKEPDTRSLLAGDLIKFRGYSFQVHTNTGDS